MKNTAPNDPCTWLLCVWACMHVRWFGVCGFAGSAVGLYGSDWSLAL